MSINEYEQIRSGGAGYYEQKRGLIAVWGKEAIQFLDGLITNDMKTNLKLAEALETYWVPTSRAGTLTIKGAK